MLGFVLWSPYFGNLQFRLQGLRVLLPDRPSVWHMPGRNAYDPNAGAKNWVLPYLL